MEHIQQPGAAGARSVRVGIFGGSLDTGNLGVSALGISTVRGLEDVLPGIETTLFDYGRGRRQQLLQATDWQARVDLIGSSYSRRYYRPWNQQQLHTAASLGLARIHPVLRWLRSHDALLDVSGGDSFADIYGEWRIRAVSAPKRLALRLGRPLILLPQTYGPFQRESSRALARELLIGAKQAWARDERGLEVLQKLLGPDFDPARHRSGVDVAFGLPVAEPDDPKLVAWLRKFTAGSDTVLGLNVSGLLHHERRTGGNAFGLRQPYAELVQELAERLLAVPGRKLLLIPHVCPPCTPDEDDEVACRALYEQLPPELRARARVVPALRDPMQAKWLVGRCEWFCGARMHACIAALSQGIATAMIAYSDKSLGVFESVGSGETVFDGRELEAKALLDGIVATVERREALRERLARGRERVLARWRSQFEAIGQAILPAGM